MKSMLGFIGLGLLLLGVMAMGCSRSFWGGAAGGAAATSAAYELRSKQQMGKLDEEYKSGRMSKEEYEARQAQIKEGSIFY